MAATAGRGMFSALNRRRNKWQDDQQWLEGVHAADMPSVGTVMQSCLIHPIQEQVPDLADLYTVL